mmetsp:Transcript_37040/g.59981  ORF Transcript_37040/g.59981 Transcript_37040/m.59981 type:complete len:504 (+) Transcript_37040:31-1542(+)
MLRTRSMLLPARAARSVLLRSIPIQHSSTSAATSSEPPALWKFFQRYQPVEIPLTEWLPGVPTPDTSSYDSLPLPQTKVTTLPNGVRVASQDTYGHLTTLSVYVDAGSRYETSANNGVSHLLEQLAFKSTPERSAFKLVREVEYLGGAVAAQASREQMVYTAEFLRTKLPYFVSLLANTVNNKEFKATEVKEALEQLEAASKDLEANAQNLVLEGLHAEAYRYSTLGLPLLAPARNIPILNGNLAADFKANLYTPSRIVVSAAGVDHAELVDYAFAAFGDLPAGAAPAKQAAKYVGGEWRVQTVNTNVTHAAIGFEGVSYSDKDLATSVVLHSLLGGGSSFSSGGPGKGMYTRLFLNVLNKFHFIQSATAFNVFYADSGLFGIHGTSDSAHAKELVEVLAAQLSATAGPLTALELSRAKAQTKSSFLMNLESRPVLADDVGRQVLVYGKRFSPSELIAQIDAVSAADIQRLAKRLLKSAPTVALYGDTTNVPEYGTIAKMFTA